MQATGEGAGLRAPRIGPHGEIAERLVCSIVSPNPAAAGRGSDGASVGKNSAHQ